MSEVTATADGFVVDAATIAEAFAIEPASVQAQMRAGQIVSRFETGVGEDAGRWRLTFFRAGRALRLTVNADGAVLSRARFDAPMPGAGTSG